MAKIAGLTLEIGGEVTPLNKALTGVNRTSRELQSELRQVDRLLKLDPTNTDLLNQKQAILGQTVDTTKEKLEKLKEAERQAQEQFQKGEISEEQYRALQREVIKTEKDLEKFEDRLKKTNPRLEEFGAKAKKAGENLKDVGGTLTKNVTVPLAAAGAGLVAVGTKFDDAYDKIRIGTGLTGEALQDLNNDFDEVLGTVPAGFDEISTAITEFNTRLGLSGEPLQDLSRQALELARITGEDLGAVIEETSQAFQAFNLPAEDYGKSLDYIFKVSQSTGIGITRLEQNMVKFSPTLKQLGLGFEESATLMGQLDKAGVDVEQTLAGLTRSIANMAKDGITDANEAIEVLFNEIKGAPSDLAGTQKALEIFGNRAGPAMASAIREGKMEYQDLMNEFRNSDETILGVADETKDFAERFAELRGEIMKSLKPLGEQLFNAINGLIPLFQKIVGFIGNLIQKFVDLSPTTQKVILIVAGLAAALGPLLSLVGTMITLIGSMTTAAAGLGLTLNAMLGWIGLIAAAITALVGVMAWWISSSNDQVKQSEKLVEQATKEKRAYEDLKAAQEDKMQASLAEIGYTQQLWQELQTLADENGNVTEANRSRAQFIIGELNSALGLELELIDGKINGLDTEGQKIDELIQKKRAQIQLESLEPTYKEAIINLSKKQAEQSELEIQMDEKATNAKKLRLEAEEAMAAGRWITAIKKENAAVKEEAALANLGKAYLLNLDTISQYTADKESYENAMMASTEGNYEEIENIIVNSTKRTYKTAVDLVGKSKDEQQGILGEQYASALVTLDEYAKNHKKGIEGYTAEGLKLAEQYATDTGKAYEEVGGEIVDGTIKGVDGKEFNLKTTISTLFRNAVQWAKDNLKIESPSKVFRDEVGKYLVLGVAQGIKDNEGVLKAEMESLIDGIKSQVGDLQSYIDGIEKEIKQLQKSRETANEAEKKNLDSLIRAKREEIDSIRDNIKALQSEQREYENRARAYKEASDLIKEGLTETAGDIGIEKERSSLEYRLWVSVYGDTATEAEKLQRQEEYLTEQYSIQGDVISATEEAYRLMVEEYGEAHESSRRLANQLLQEKVAYEELYSSILNVRKAKGELSDTLQRDLYSARSSYGDFLRENYTGLLQQGVSADDIFTYARKVSGLDKAESAVKSIVVNQTVTTTAATPSEMREATRDGVRLATKEAYA